MEENTNNEEREDPTPLTDEEFARYQEEQKRKSGIIKCIIDFILGFFR